VKFTLPGKEGVEWELVLDTKLEEGFAEPGCIRTSGDEVELVERSLALFQLHTGSQAAARSDTWAKRRRWRWR